jgi:hypothetical protein
MDSWAPQRPCHSQEDFPMRRWILGLALGLVWLACGNGSAKAQEPALDINRFYYYPYYYFPHSYWPGMGPQWPERPGMPYMRPPAYMAYPPFQEPHWRYDFFEPHRYYRGFHYWLDQF